MSEWKDISTVPKDGTSVLLYGGDWVYEAYWLDVIGWYTAQPDGDNPTHWQPVPEPPNEE